MEEIKKPTVTPEVQLKINELHKRLVRDALDVDSKWLRGKRKTNEKLYRAIRYGDSNRAVELRKEDFIQEVAARNPRIANLMESTKHLVELHRRKEQLLEELLYTAALKEEVEHGA